MQIVKHILRHLEQTFYAGAVNNAQINRNGSDSGTNLSDTPDVGDIMGLALDLDSGTNYFKILFKWFFSWNC